MSAERLAGFWRALQASALIGACVLSPGRAAEPPVAPALVVETGAHRNLARAFATDGEGRFVVTASDDKTARVWSALDGQAGHVLRVPAGTGSEGRLQAVALTRDGHWVAVAGRTGTAWAGTSQIYVFERASGRLVRRLDTGAAEPVVALALAADARALAVGLAGRGGLRLLDFASGQVLGEDREFGGSAYALDIGPDGRRIVAGGLDGLLRLYTFEQGRLVRHVRAPPEAGKLISQARFSPDGRLIAVGFDDAPQVLIHDARDLQIVAAPEPAEQGGAFSSLAWSADGQELWAGGSRREGSRWLLRRWVRGDWARHSEHAVAGASVLGLASLPGQRILWLSAEPGWGVVDGTGRARALGIAALANFSGQARSLAVSPDGQRVRFAFAPRAPAFEFDLPGRQLRPLAPETAASHGPWQTARTGGPGLPRVDGWEDGRAPRLAGKPLPLAPVEVARSLDLAEDGQRFVLGSDEKIWLFDGAGQPQWSRTAAGIVWAVKLAAQGRLVVAALNDGTLRWYRASDGAELLAVLPHADRRRWIAFTPSGYYDAAVGAEDLLGWQVNRGADAAPDFYPAWTLRARMRRADVVDRVLAAGDEREALRQANAAAGRTDEPAPTLADALPPVIEALGATQLRLAERTATVRVRLRTIANAPQITLRARADGRPAAIEAGAKLAANAVQGSFEHELRVRFSGEPAKLRILAENRHGLGAPLDLDIVWVDKPPPEPPDRPAAAAPDSPPRPPAAPADGPARAPRLVVLAIGVGQFRSPDVTPLRFPGKDVRDFVATMRQQQGRLYRSVEARVLHDQHATRDAIVDGLEWLQREVTQHDVGMLFVSGHGASDAALGYLYIAHDFDAASVRRTGVGFVEFKRTLDNLAGKALFFIDTCHAGHVIGGARTRSAQPNDATGAINELTSAESGVVVFSASTGRQVAFEKDSWGNGAFTKALIEGLAGKADLRGTGRVTHKMLDYYVSDRVKELTEGRQSPVTQAPGGVPDFPLAVLR